MEFLIEPISNSNYDIVIGNRFSKLEEMPQYRKIGNKMLDKFTKIAADLLFSDSQSGFRSYSKMQFMKLNLHLKALVLILRFL